MTKPWEKYQKQNEIPPWEKYKKSSVQNPIRSEQDKYSKIQSLGMGALEGGSLGFADEIGGALKALNPGSSIYGTVKKDYQTERDKIREEMQHSREDNPDTHMGGDLIGAIGSVFIPGLGWLSASKGAKILNTIGKGAIGGGLVGAGTSDADLTEGEVGKFSGDVGKGILVGSTAGAAGHLLGKVSNSLPDTSIEGLKRFAGKRAVKAVTGGNIGAVRQITKTTHKNPGDVSRTEEALVKTGQDLIDEPGIMGWASKSEEMAPRLEQARKNWGQKIGDISDKIDETTPNAVNAKNIARNIESFSESIPDTPRGIRLKEKLSEEADTYSKMGKMSFRKANAYKQDYKFVPTDADALVSNADAVKKIRQIISKEMEDTAERLSIKKPFELTQRELTDGKIRDLPSPYNPELDNLLNEYKLAKQKYGSFKNLSNAATDRYQKNLSNRFVSPSDYAIGSAAGTAKAIAGGAFDPASLGVGIAAGAANKFARERGSAFAARSANGAAKLLGSISDNLPEIIKRRPQLLGKWAGPMITAYKRGPQSVAAANFILQQTQPEYRKLVNQPAGEEEEE